MSSSLSVFPAPMAVEWRAGYGDEPWQPGLWIGTLEREADATLVLLIDGSGDVFWHNLDLINTMWRFRREWVQLPYEVEGAE